MFSEERGTALSQLGPDAVAAAALGPATGHTNTNNNQELLLLHKLTLTVQEVASERPRAYLKNISIENCIFGNLHRFMYAHGSYAGVRVYVRISSISSPHFKK